MSGIFPAVQPEAEVTNPDSLPLCREVAWDFERGCPIFSGGHPVEVTGTEAVRVWAWKALMTPRFRHDIYSWDYGCEAESLIGKPFTAEVKENEAIRCVREALMPNPYITDTLKVIADFALSGTGLTIRCAVSTIYGEVEVNV